MTNEYSHSLAYFREFANASRSLCQTLFLTEPQQNQELLRTIVSALQCFPHEAYEDDELIRILDDFVDDGLPLDSVLTDEWASFLLMLGFAHVRPYRARGTVQSIERALHLCRLRDTFVTRDTYPRLWAYLQILIGDCKQILASHSGVSTDEHFEHYLSAFEVIQQYDDPSDWLDVATRLGRAYAEKTTGDRSQNLRTAADLFGKIKATLERIGSKQGVADTQVALADLRAALNNDDQDIQLALEYYHSAFYLYRNMADEKSAKEVAEKINALETVNFTTYYPRTGVPGRKYGLVVYAHLPELRNDVNVDAQKFSTELGDSIPRPRRTRSNVKLERGTLITVVPECYAVEFDPPELTKRWDDNWTRFLFDFKLNQDLVGEVVVLRISVQVAGIEIASISHCAIEVIESQQGDEDENPLAHAKSDNQTSTLYQKIFVSYSRRDRKITERYKLAQIALGNEAFIDVDDLRAGENWKAGLARAIDVADVFQLFWSGNSANSEYCRYEWNYALEFRCPDNKCEGFVRPVYWEKPMPDPPPELSHVNFKYVPFDDNAKMGANRDEGKHSEQSRDA